jgi:thiol-disulfide isomerase/thioredoxin
VAWALAAVELGLALSLLFTPTARVGATAALAVLVFLSILVMVNLARGRSVDCHCFGRLSSGASGWSSVARNAAFSALAALVIFDGSFMWLFGLVGVVAVVVWLGPAALAGLRQRDPQRAGTRLADFSLPDASGGMSSFEGLVARQLPIVLVFSNPGCGPCSALMADVRRWQEDLDDRVTVAVVSSGSLADNLAKADAYGLRRVMVDQTHEVFRALGVNATPSALLINHRGVIAAPSAAGVAAIVDLVERAMELSGDPEYTRRGMLVRAAQGVASLTVLPAVAAACSNTTNDQSSTTTGGATDTTTNDQSSTTTGEATGTTANVNDLEIDGAYFCNQTFALCTTAPCEVSKTDPTIANCRCVMENSYSIGFKTCAERAQSGTEVHSNFSTVNVNSAFSTLSCGEDAPWANCLDVVCEIDKYNPALATCQCLLVEKGPSFTFGGACDPSACTSTIWSAAPPGYLGLAQYEEGMKQANQKVTLPPDCPATSSTAGSTQNGTDRTTETTTGS